MAISSGPSRRGFLLMPFDDDLDWLKDEIVNAGMDANVRVRRADDISLPGVILDQVFGAISQADVVIAVCTGLNPNVFFELGYAWHTQDAVLVASSKEDLPFDVGHLRTVFYGKLESDHRRTGFRQRLAQAIDAAAAAKVTSDQDHRTRNQEDIDRRCEWLLSRLQARVGDSPLPTIYITIVPLIEYEHLFQPDGPTTRTIANISPPPVFGIPEIGKVIFPFLYPEFKGLTLNESDVGYYGYDWMEFYNDGAFLGAITGNESLQHGVFQFEDQSRESVNDSGFYDNVVTYRVVARLRAFGILASQFNINSEVIIRLGIANIALPVTIATGPDRTGVRNTRLVDSPISTDVRVQVLDDLTSISGTLRTAARLLNDLMTAFRWPRCFQLETDGTVVLSTWGSRWRASVEHWVQENSISVLDDYEA